MWNKVKFKLNKTNSISNVIFRNCGTVFSFWRASSSDEIENTKRYEVSNISNENCDKKCDPHTAEAIDACIIW